ncbi:MAG TPA: carboxypeptidase regulatory-like domain-containing protein [Vicinamibacterales bacterium]|nr:carboxypeptidase regulatory-like domain-containing protein [Vicinamibacterales bacterium]
MHIAWLLVVMIAQASGTVSLSGVVRDATGLPLPGVSVEADGRLAAVTEDDGTFSISPGGHGPFVLRLSLPGFEARQLTVDAASAQPLVIVLAVAAMSDEITVRAAPAATSAERLLDFGPIQTYRTAGAQGDLFRALQTMPGAAAVDEAAGLFVRGGDVSEVLVTLDGGTMAHPYRYETPTGGFRGAVDPLLISGLAFSAGGFGARYGNALSAVIDMRGLERPAAVQIGTTAGLAGLSASGAAPAGRFGARASANRTLTRLLFAVNDQTRRFEQPPEGTDASLGLTWNGGRAGSGRLFVLSQRDRVAVEVEQDAFTGPLRSASRHDFAVGRWDVPVARWTVSAAWGTDFYKRATSSGALDLSIGETAHSWRVEAQRATARVTWLAGTNGALSRTDVHGMVPSRGGDLGGVSGVSRFAVTADDWFAGAFAEGTIALGPLTVSPGVRTDRFSRSAEWEVDPRLNLRLALPAAQSLRLAAGLYSQAPAAAYFDAERGAARLRPMRAHHYVAGYERGTEDEALHVRLEAYRKRYRRLPLEAAGGGYTGDGYGWAHGVDAFARWRTAGLEITGIASWLEARRRWTAVDQQARYPLPEGAWRPDFEVPWSVRLITQVPVRRTIQAGASWRIAAGRPFTPVTGALATTRGFEPVYATINSGRLPRYERLDLSVSWLRPLAGGTAILFGSVDNVLDRSNFFSYAYSPDYAVRRPVVTAAPRSFYAGITFRR